MLGASQKTTAVAGDKTIMKPLTLAAATLVFGVSAGLSAYAQALQQPIP
jgi:hypothetical protein